MFCERASSPVVEVNSSFYAIPSTATTASWADRTPERLPLQRGVALTGHHVDVARVPDALRALLPAPMRSKKVGRVPSAYLARLPVSCPI